MFWKSPFFLLVVATCLWGGNFVVGKELVSSIPPITLSFMRWVVAMFIVVPLFGIQTWKNRSLIRKYWKMLLFLSIVGVAGFNTILYIAVQYTSSINAALMNAATPMVILLLSAAFLQEKFSMLRIIGIIISFIGVFWIISHGSLYTVTHFDFNQGDIWMLLAIVFWGLYSIGIKKIAGKLPANSLFTITVLLCVLMLFPLSMIELFIQHKHVNWMGSSAVGVVYIGIFASVVAFLSWNKAVSILGPARCGSFLYLIPLFSTIFATIFAGERVHVYHWLGASLILVGVYVSTKLPVKIGMKSKKTAN